ncbi:circadian clock protein KaiC [Cyanobium gracile]|uniref:non-specific serine/threonine protein kinase n=1 Tax=Cyanobium gracile UHCC 0281 TaxID=3110309 RepID=A0ABU5SWZ4_9CYAN|nr:circadian clock protein KaiC [Cyanobium gracile]MEA5443048.1 circadian clock protein KaiC [Cyanobium gracile UHCC 0281]
MQDLASGSDKGPSFPGLAKAPTGIRGFEAISDGGLPRGRPTLVTGASGSGKTMFAMEFLVRGALQFNEPGVLLTFEESAEDIAANVRSLGFDIDALVATKRLAICAMPIDPSEVITAGVFDLEALFVRLEGAVARVGARRVALDTIEVLLTCLGNEAIVRGELSRLFHRLKERGLTTVVTGERGRAGDLTRFGIEEYVSDCVVVLDQRVDNEISTRRLRIVKYRGSVHGTNEFPFLITDRGLTVLPITAVALTYPAANERISCGIERLDHMLGGGIFRGSTVLISGSAGTGKTTVVAHLLDAACRRGERALFLSYEESPDQLIRNMASVGLDLQRWIDAGLLLIWAERSTAHGLEEHLGRLDRMLEDFQPQVAALDAMGSLIQIGSQREVTAALARQIDLMKGRGITAVFTSLTHGEEAASSAVAVSSLTDTWLLLRNVESDGERNRLLFVIKSRGMAHSNQVREFVLTDHGAELLDVAIGPQGVLTGSARLQQQKKVASEAAVLEAEIERRRAALAQQAAASEASIAALQGQLQAERAAFEAFVAEEHRRQSEQAIDQSGLDRQEGGSG